MGFNPENSAIKVDTALEEKLKGASFEEIKAYLASAAVEQRLVERDIFDSSILIPTELASAAPRKFAKVVIVNGIKNVLEARSEQELLSAETEFYRAQLQPATQTESAAQPRNERGRFVSAEDAAANAELELAFKRGDISTSEYIQRSGAVAEYLEKAGVPLEDLQASVAEKQVQRFEQSWADATETWKSRHPEWGGGEANRDTIGTIIAENNLVDAEDKVAALELAYHHARENNLLVENPDTAYQRELQSARSAAEITAVNHKHFGSGFFNK